VRPHTAAGACQSLTNGEENGGKISQRGENMENMEEMGVNMKKYEKYEKL
jgi:hypothetical protein